ncbi:hypothetical protein OAG61_03890, partial [Akkermansiaceae bacterium]|nr:hypothetical protein [Akkermansiaceae bacterium]
ALKKCTRLSGKWKVSASFLLPNHLAILANFKNPATSSYQNYFLTSNLFNLSRHTIGFGTVISLFAIFNFDRHNGIIATNLALTNENCPGS